MVGVDVAKTKLSDTTNQTKSLDHPVRILGTELNHPRLNLK